MANFWEKVPANMYNCGWPYDNCAHGEPIPGDSLKWTLIKFWACYMIIVVIISFLITLWFYLVYRHKKDEHPWKHAVKRSWPWWIVVFLLPIVVVIFSFLYDQIFFVI